jgi:hypothetical protein
MNDILSYQDYRSVERPGVVWKDRFLSHAELGRGPLKQSEQLSR